MNGSLDIRACVARHGGDASRLLSVLRDVQAGRGSLDAAAIDEVANALAVPRVRVEAVATFHHLLHTQPRGAHEILFSDNIVDRMQGKAEMMAYLCERMWLEPGKVSEDGLVYVGSTSDTGMGDQGPAALVNGRALPSLDRTRLDLIAGLIRNGKPLDAWPPMLFEVATNVRRTDLLLGTLPERGRAVRSALE